MHDTELKHCNGCKADKPLLLFYRNASRKDGRDTWCKECSNKYSKEHYRLNAPRRREQLGNSRRKRMRENATVAFTRMISRHRNRFDANVDSLVAMYELAPTCCYCRLSLTPDRVSFDHATPLVRGGSKTLENIVVSCADCNFLKGTRTALEFASFIVEYCGRFNGRLPADDRAEGVAKLGHHRERLSEETSKEEATV